jgi:glutaryl-CoA dehydrogenase (non-decarboxylating)
MGKMGFFGGVIPKEYGGTEAGFLSTILVVEEVARISASYCMLPANQTVGPALTLLRLGTKAQKEKYVPALTKGEMFGLFCSTEPDAGSDLGSMKMTAVEKNGSFILNGNKTWVTGATEADMGLFWAWTTKEKGVRGGLSCFIVELKGTPGVSSHNIGMLGLRCDGVGEVAFNDVKVPKDRVLGEAGAGYGYMMDLLANTRLCAAARAVGVHGACLDYCINLIKAQGRGVKNYQMLQSKISEMFVDHEAAQLMIYRAAANKDKGTESPTDVPAAKYFAVEAAVKAAQVAMEIHGLFGFPMDPLLRRLVIDSRAFPITEGTRNILKLNMGGQILR